MEFRKKNTIFYRYFDVLRLRHGRKSFRELLKEWNTCPEQSNLCAGPVTSPAVNLSNSISTLQRVSRLRPECGRSQQTEPALQWLPHRVSWK